MLHSHPIIELTIDQLIARLRKLALKQGTTISGIKASREEVLDTTGVRVLGCSVTVFLLSSALPEMSRESWCSKNMLQFRGFLRTG